jgi:hypothetical protein
MPLLPGDIGHFPRFGFGLWQVPQATITIEALLVVAGACSTTALPILCARLPGEASSEPILQVYWS